MSTFKNYSSIKKKIKNGASMDELNYEKIIDYCWKVGKELAIKEAGLEKDLLN